MIFKKSEKIFFILMGLLPLPISFYTLQTENYWFGTGMILLLTFVFVFGFLLIMIIRMIDRNSKEA